MMGEIRENKRIYPVKAGTAITGRMRDISYGGAGSCHHKNGREIHLMGEQSAATIREREREIHLMREQVAATMSEREEIHHGGAGNCHHE
jgi:hypothetical protein